MGALLTGNNANAPQKRLAAGESQRVATLNGRGLTVWRQGRDVLIAWGDDVLPAARAAAAQPDRSVAPRCTAWAREGKPAPQRLGAVWPARCWSPARDPSGVTPAWREPGGGPARHLVGLE